MSCGLVDIHAFQWLTVTLSHPHSFISLTLTKWIEQGSCAGLEFKAYLEKSLNFIKLKKSLKCFGKQVEGLEKFGICLCETFNKTW